MHELQEYVTKAEFCRRLRITRTALFYAVKSGRVVVEEWHGRPRIEFYRNKHTFVSTSQHPERYMPGPQFGIANNSKKARHKKTDSGSLRNIKSPSSHPLDDVPDPVDEDGDFHPAMSRLEAESVKQVYLAKQAKLKFLKDAGLLVEVETVKREWEEIATRVQKTMLSIPDRVAEIFATITDADKIHSDLTTEIRYALSSLQYRVKIEDKHDRIEEIVEAEDEVEEDPKA